MLTKVYPVALLALCIAACGASPVPATRTALNATAEAVVGADRVLEIGYLTAAEDAVANAETLAEYEAIMEPWNTAVDALVGSKYALLAAERALDAIERGIDADWAGVVGCLATALVHLVDGMNGVGLDPGPQLRGALQLVVAFGGECSP